MSGSLMPCHLSGNDRRVGASSCPRVDPDRQLSAPGRHHLPGHADPVADVELDEPARSRAWTPIGANSWMRPDESASVAEGELALDPSQHEPTCDRGPSGRSRSRARARRSARRARRPTRRGRSRRAGRTRRGPDRGQSRIWFFSQMSRRPWRVNHGSSCSIDSATGAMRLASPPVATIVDSPRTSSNRSHMPSMSDE